MSHSIASSAELCARVGALQSKYPIPNDVETGDRPSAAVVLQALDEFMECARYLNTRRSDKTIVLDSEAAVQDLLFLILRPLVRDLVPETPTERNASRYAIKDFRSATHRTIIEAKYIRDRDHGRMITKELHDDIETYRSDPVCDSIIFFIYDPDVNIPDRGALKRHLEVERYYGGRKLACHVVVHP